MPEDAFSALMSAGSAGAVGEFLALIKALKMGGDQGPCPRPLRALPARTHAATGAAARARAHLPPPSATRARRSSALQPWPLARVRVHARHPPAPVPTLPLTALQLL